jgi:hypothetical protein
LAGEFFVVAATEEATATRCRRSRHLAVPEFLLLHASDLLRPSLNLPQFLPI